MLVNDERSILECCPAAFGVTGQTVVGAIGNAFDFVELLRFFTLGNESIEKIRGGFGVVRKLLRRLRVLLEVLRTNPVLVILGDSLRNPLTMPVRVRAVHDEGF